MAILTDRKAWQKPETVERRQKRGALLPCQQANVRNAISFLRIRLGSTQRLAEAYGVSVVVAWKLMGSSRPVSARVAFLTARLAGVGMDDILEGRWPYPSECPHCGRR